MANTPEGGKRFRARMVERYGGEAGYREYMQGLGRKGGSKSNAGGFASDIRDKNGLTGRERASVYGVIGGRKSRRGPSRKSKEMINE